MGFSASLGGPLLNLLLGMGGPFLLSLARNGWAPLKVGLTPAAAALSASVGIALAVHVVMFSLSRFRAGRAQGLILVSVYAASMGAVVAAELGMLPFLPGARKY